MLRKDLRICRGRQFNFIYRNGRRLVGKYLIMFIVQSDGPEQMIGIVTSKKIGNAVIRNKVKRQIREVVRRNLGGLTKGNQIVLVARHGIKESTSKLIENDYLGLIRKAAR